MIVDSHCHLDYSNLYNQLDDVIKRAEYNQVKYFLTICTTLESFDLGIQNSFRTQMILTLIRRLDSMYEKYRDVIDVVLPKND